MRGPSPSCRIAGVQTVHGRRGVNRVHFSGRLKGRPLAPGLYLITIEAVRASSRTRVGYVAVEIVPPSRRLTKAQRTAPVGIAVCTSGGAELALLAFGGLPLGSLLVGPTGPSPGKPSLKPESGVLGVTAESPRDGLPYVSLPHSSASLGGLAVVLGIVLGLSLLVMAVALTPPWILPGPVGALVYDRRDYLFYGGVATALSIGLGIVITLAL